MSNASKIYTAIFKESIPPHVENQFNKAFAILAKGFPEGHVVEYKAAVESSQDIEALELAARHRKRLPLLVSAFEIMVYLGETVPGNQSKYFNFKKRRFIGFLSIGYGLCRSLVKFIKGWFLLRKAKNV